VAPARGGLFCTVFRGSNQDGGTGVMISMTKQDIEKQWLDACAKDDQLFGKLVDAGVIDTQTMNRLPKSDNELVVGTEIEAQEPQRDGTIFTRPMSRRMLIDSLRK
jgi:hypothetical protein